MDVWFTLFYRWIFRASYPVITWGQSKYIKDPNTLPFPFNLLLRFNLRYINGIVARNTVQEVDIAKVVPQMPLQVVYWSSDPANFKATPIDKEALLKHYSIPETQRDSFMVGYVGRLVPEKGIMNLLEAISELPDVCSVLIGKGAPGYIQELESRITSLNLSNRCFLLGSLEYTALPEIYNLIDMLALPTTNHNGYYELFGRVLPEAMLSRTLVVGSDNGAIPEVIGNAQCIFPQNDATALRTTIQTLMKLPPEEKQAVLDQNYTYATVNFTVDAFKQRLLTLVDVVLQ